MRILLVMAFLATTASPALAQDCEVLKQQMGTQEAELDVLRVRMDEASGYDEKKAIAQEIRAVENESRLLSMEYRACMSGSGEMGDPEMLRKGLRQRSQGTLVAFAGGALMFLGATATGGLAPLIYAGAGLGILGSAQTVSGSFIVLKATKGDGG